MMKVILFVLFLFCSSQASSIIGISGQNLNLVSNTVQYTFFKSPYNTFHINRRWGPAILTGFESGINISNIKQAGSSGTNMKLGFKSGLFIRFKYDETLSIQSGLIYSSKGYKLESDYILNNGAKHIDEFTMHLSYLDIPILYRISFGDKYKIDIEPGVYLSALLSAKQIGKVTIENEGEAPITSLVNENAKDFFKTYDAGLTLSLGIEYPITHNRRGANYSTFFRTGYDFGLINISTTDLQTLKNRNIHLSVGLIMELD